MMDTYEFSYNTFDRQMHNLLLMSQILINGRDDYGTMELTMDIRSLCTKASRLCYMSEYDIALQREDILHSRRSKNAEYLSILDKLLKDGLEPLMMRAVKDFREGKGLQGNKSPEFPNALSSLLPRLVAILKDNSDDSDNWNALIKNIDDTESLFAKKVEITRMPGVKDAERFWMLIQYYALMCYLLMHFRRATECTNVVLSQEEIERIFTSAVLNYANSEVGKTELERYFAVLKFNNNQLPLNKDMLMEAQKSLLTDVPTRLQLCFIRNINNNTAFANEFYRLNPSVEEYQMILAVVAKYQMLAHQIYKIAHPEADKQIYNEIFNLSVKGKTVDLYDLRIRIERMLRLVSKKNHWFCVWAVLKHHNLLNDTSAESFARQMMHEDWFRNIDQFQHFKGDNLRDYTGYLSSTDYTRWNLNDYRTWCRLNNKTKLSLDLSEKFLRICMDMDEEFMR